MVRTGDALRDFNRWDEEQWEKEQKLPICVCCGERIFDEYAYRIAEDLYCEKCIENSLEYIEVE